MMASGANTLIGPFKGDGAVYLLQIDQKIDAKPLEDVKSVINQLQPSLASRVDYAVFEAVKDISDIQDNRAKFF
jgi:peptidyl-prolyl cis-trans isomerase D